MRAGTPCKRKDLYGNGRCRLHGGLSTGPRTEEGKRRSAANGRRPKRKRRTEKKPSP
ncbi:HGGxSTG domain-containing protein [uncultured Desulfovibrio sp.]|uniref:HGGxSTG domain-containing protein n=1 Tax=uncultured Desulfovibrio sp. TaxID=167968 RepID=UPI00344061AC